MNKSILIIVLSTVFLIFLILSIIGCISQIKTIVDELRELIHPGKLTRKRLKNRY
jgi:5-bromo-4-chloroindolyl phosphate hydrolysis protein